MAFFKLPDLDMRNVLHVVKENFERVGLKAYAVRMMYTGEHALTPNLIKAKFEKSIQLVNQGYTDIPVNGFLLVYDSYFVHILEGSENTLHRQLRFLFDIEKQYIKEMTKRDEEDRIEALRLAAEVAAAEAAAYPGGVAARPPEENPPEEYKPPERIVFRRLKMLMLMFEEWRAVYARPPSLVGKLDVYAPISEHMEQLRICLDKIFKLIQLSKEEGTMLSFEGLSANDPKIEALPEVALLDYLLTSPYIMDLREVASYHRRVDDHIFYYEQVWPLPAAFTPRHLYKLKIDDSFVEPLPVMPWEMKTEEDEEREEAQSKGSSSSD